MMYLFIEEVAYKSGIAMIGDCKSSGNCVTIVANVMTKTENKPIQFCL